MRKSIAFLLMGLTFVLGIMAGSFGLLWATGNLSPSRDVQEVVPTLSLDATPESAVSDQLSSQLQAIEDKVDALATQVDGLSSGEGQAVAPEETPAEDESDESSENSDASSETAALDRARYQILKDNSEARFYIGEEFFGNQTTVVGITDEMAGDVIIDFADPTASQLGMIAVNARTFKTDQEERDKSIRGLILRADEFEFITFEPSELLNLPEEPVSVGDTVEFQIAGNLSIRGVTLPVTFDATVTIASDDQIEGVVQTEIAHADYGMVIQPPPGVSGVGDTVVLELAFTAQQVEG